MIIGLTGTLASGKGVISEFLKKKGFVYLSLSNELREIARENNIELNRKNLQDLGNKLRNEKGPGVLADLVVNKIINQKYINAVVDGLRNPAEIKSLKSLKNFFIIAVDAPKELRFKRIQERARENEKNIEYEEFLKADSRDLGEDDENGQQVRKCMDLADFILINDSSMGETNKKLDELYDKLELKIPRPSWDDYFMEISKAVARRATCNRGRSGCVITKNKQILVTGYVGSPLGLPHCDEVGHQIKTVIHEDGTTSQHCLRTTHAEQNAICQAAKLGILIESAILYCKMTPCSTCAKMIINSGIIKVVCEYRYHKGKESEEMFNKANVELNFLNESILQYKNQ